MRIAWNGNVGHHKFMVAKDNHYSESRLVSPILQPRSLEGKVRFRPSCCHPVSTLDWNKLIGFSTTINPFAPKTGELKAPHHNNSTRLVWRAVRSNEQFAKDRLKFIEVGYYHYINGVVDYGSIDLVRVGEFNHFKIKLENSGAISYTIGSRTLSVSNQPTPGPIGYLLGFYHGGNLPAPDDMIAEMYVYANRSST